MITEWWSFSRGTGIHPAESALLTGICILQLLRFSGLQNAILSESMFLESGSQTESQGRHVFCQCVFVVCIPYENGLPRVTTGVDAMSDISIDHSGIETSPIDPAEPVAVVCVSEKGEMAFHLLSALMSRVSYFCRNVVFYSVDSDRDCRWARKKQAAERREASVERLALHVEEARRRGLNAASRYAAGPDPLGGAEILCSAIAEDFPKATFYFCSLLETGEKGAGGSWCPKLRVRLLRRGLTTAILPLTADDFLGGVQGAKA